MKTTPFKILSQCVFFGLLAILALNVMSCKKESEETDDPNIDDAAPNMSLSYSGALGTNADTAITILGVPLSVQMYTDADIKFVYLEFSAVGTFFQKNVPHSVNGSMAGFAPVLTKGDLIDSSSAVWGPMPNLNTFLYDEDKLPLPGGSFGINGQGDKYFAFRTGTLGAYRFGWMKINVSSDANTVLIKEAALSKVVNTPIKVGAK